MEIKMFKGNVPKSEGWYFMHDGDDWFLTEVYGVYQGDVMELWHTEDPHSSKTFNPDFSYSDKLTFKQL